MNRAAVTRIYELDRDIRLGCLSSAAAAARKYGVSRRSIERDLEQLRSLGAPLRYNRSKEMYEYEGNPITLPGQWLTEREIALILIAERALRVFTNTSFDAEIHPAFNKLLAPVRKNRDAMEYIASMCASVHFHRPVEPARDVREEFSILFEAIQSRKRISMLYESGRGVREERREVEPYALVNSGGDWYLIALCRRNRDVRMFTLSNMRELRIEDHYFLVPDDFDVQEYLGSGFGRMRGANPVRVDLCVRPPAARWVARSRWHATQIVRQTGDGTIRLTMRCPVTESLVRWVLQMGECVKVLAPKTLREQVVSMARALAEHNG